MALTFSEITRTVIGDRRMVLTTVTFDSSYPTGGEAIAPSDVGLSQIDMLFAEPGFGYQVLYKRSTQKLLVRTPVGAVAAHTHTGAAHTHTGAAHTHVTEQAGSYTQNEVSASTTPGAGQSTTPGAGGTGGAIIAAPGAEVADTTDLSTLASVVMVIGR